MSLALPVLKRQLCHFKHSLVVGRRAQSSLMARLYQLTSEPVSSPSSIPEPPVLPPTPSPAVPPSVSSHESSHTPKKTSKKPRQPKPTAAKKKKAPLRNLLEDSKIQTYLDHIAETSNTVTLSDIDRIRPTTHADPDTPEYEEQYNALVDRLCQSFSKKQLLLFLEILGIERRRGSSKRHCAVQIIEGSWGWPSLTEVQEKKRDWSEVQSESLPLDPRQAFLILGKDGANLHTLSRKYNVHIGFSTNPLALNIEGLRGALKTVREHVVSFKGDVVEEYHSLSSDKPIPSEMLQRISRLSGAFAESFGEGQIRISYRKNDHSSSFIAKRLMSLILCDMESIPGTILAYIPPDSPALAPVPVSLFPRSYALYPFLSSRSLPWNVHASGAFRARKVAEWIGVNLMEDVQKSGGLELGRGRVLDLEENDADIQQTLFKHLPEPSHSRNRVISASLGHILLTPPPSSHVSLIPPLQGQWPISNLLKWIRHEHVGRIFTPCLPAPILHSTPQRQRLLHRLIYEAPSISGNVHQACGVLELEMVLPDSADSSPLTSSETSLGQICRVGHQSTADLMLPNRPMDIRFSVFDSSVLPTNLWPSELQEYFRDLSLFFYNGEPNASPPITIFLDDVKYRLRSSVTVRQREADASAPHLEASIPAITEHTLDPEIDDKSSLCKITCNEPFAGEAWNTFLKGCDLLSAMRAPTKPTRNIMDADNPNITI
ncbi:hypothetical protein BDP27DRAFT_1326087 [Rhodocollybia butyracea]|uniref:SLS1 C-terminal domain-containing protein n=1 Tax=Rhodocollybia butyracea TaxID=206335 RepID=A0A9P5PNH0_9AGAR|nr:hypothetical protein BDP27DRAFT_1326087 [Rhodocollybia butyracea]